MPSNPYRPHPNSDDYLLRPFRAGRVYCNATQAKAWARFPRPFGPKSPSQGPSGRNRLQSPTGSQAIILSALRAPCAGWLTAGSKSSTKCGSTEPLTTLSSITAINFNTALGSFSSTTPNPSFFPLKTDRKSFGACGTDKGRARYRCLRSLGDDWPLL